MKLYESETMDFKGIYTPDLKKEVVAFANTNGGTIYSVGRCYKHDDKNDCR